MYDTYDKVSQFAMEHAGKLARGTKSESSHVGRIVGFMERESGWKIILETKGGEQVFDGYRNRLPAKNRDDAWPVQDYENPNKFWVVCNARRGRVYAIKQLTIIEKK